MYVSLFNHCHLTTQQTANLAESYTAWLLRCMTDLNIGDDWQESYVSKHMPTAAFLANTPSRPRFFRSKSLSSEDRLISEYPGLHSRLDCVNIHLIFDSPNLHRLRRIVQMNGN